MNPSLDFSDAVGEDTGSPQARLSECVSDDLAAWFRSIDTSHMSIVDRMVFDINRRAILEKSRSKPELPTRKLKTGTDGVFQRLLEDTSKRLESRQQPKEPPSTVRPKTPKAPDCSGVYERLLQDTRARRESSVTRMRLKEAEEREEAKALQRPKINATASAQLIDRLVSDAEKRRRKAEEVAREKERREVEEAKKLAEMHHPKRKPDMQVRHRLAAHTRRPQRLNLDTDQLRDCEPKCSPTAPRPPATTVHYRPAHKASKSRDCEVFRKANSKHEESFSPERTEGEVTEPEWVQVASRKAAYRPASAAVVIKPPVKEDLISRVLRRAVGVNMN